MKKVLLTLIVFSVLGNVVQANITVTLGEFSSPYHDTGTYYDSYDVGTFVYDPMCYNPCL